MKKYFIQILLSLAGLTSFAQTGTATISGKLDFLNEQDTVMLTSYQYGHFQGVKEFQTVYKGAVTNGRFALQVKTGAYPLYFDLILSSKKLEKNLFSLLIEGGDDLKLSEIDHHYIFSGRGSLKLNIGLRLKQIDLHFARLMQQINMDYLRRNLEWSDSSATTQLDYLHQERKALSEKAYFLLEVGILTDNMSRESLGSRFFSKDSAAVFAAFNGYRKPAILEQGFKKAEGQPQLLVYCNYYTEALLEKYAFDSCYRRHRPFTVTGAYAYTRKNFSGLLRDELATLLFLLHKNSQEDLPRLLDDALSIVKDPGFLWVLQQIRISNVKGAIAYRFSLMDADNRVRTSEEFKGRVIVMDFWYTGCPACAKSAPYLSRVEKYFQGKPVVFISVCIDKKKEMWLKSLADGKYATPNAVKVYTDGLGGEHPIIKHYQINSYPTLILVDTYGKILESPVDPAADNGSNLTKIINGAL